MTDQVDFSSIITQLLYDPTTAVAQLLEQTITLLLGDSENVKVLTSSLLRRIDGAGIDAADYQTLVDRNALLASAVGACDCWGEVPDCPLCDCAGLPGWLPLDQLAFDTYIAPVLKSMEGSET